MYGDSLLMKLFDVDMQALNRAPHAETGMNLQVVVVDEGPIAIMSDGVALPCFQSSKYFDLSDLLAGAPVPISGAPNFSLPGSYYVLENRMQALSVIGAAGLGGSMPGSPPPSGAHPLLSRRTLAAPTTFLRYISSPKDLRFTGTNLQPKTYLTTDLESRTANSGFAAVGRFALPLPLPACTVIQYELPAGSVIDAGTVAPLFGQSGGGVEVCLARSPGVRQIASTSIPEY